MKKTYLLSSENIDAISDEIASYMKKLKISSMGIIKGRLTVETLLLAWLEKAPANTEVVLETGKRFFRPYACLSFEGQQINPLENNGDDALANEAMNYFNSVMTNVGLATTYKYRAGNNIVDIKLPMVNIGGVGKIAISILLAFLTGYAINLAGTDIAKIVATEIIQPLFKMMLSLLGGLATFMIFFGVLSGICNVGNIATLSNMGMRVLGAILKRNFVALIFGVVIYTVAFGVVEFGGGMDLSVLKTIFQMLVGIVPGSLLQPFVDGNTLQIIFLAVTTGIILLILDQQAKGVIAFVNELSTVFMTAVTYFCKSIPFIVYLSFTNVILSGNLVYVLKVWKPLLVFVLAGICYIVLETLYTGWRFKFGIKNYFKLAIPLTLLAVSTSSSAACIPLLDKLCTSLGVDKKLLNFSLPISQILVNTGTVIGFLGILMGFSEVCGIAIPVPRLIVIALACYIIAIAAPHIPGGAISVMAILMAQALLPEYCLAIYIAVDVIIDMTLTGVNVTSSLNTLILAADDLGMVKKKE
ncbi:MAG: dicarboxylate/amino acid:cation symporter [Acidaminococcaceae bacterium]|nr:dicarboxylate/amino acid:cation symporter [Acidaminococcaceae bacterium]